jgi:hypothetical protein
MPSRFNAHFAAALAQVDKDKLQTNLVASRIALRRVSDSWHAIEGTVATIKLDQYLAPSDEAALLAMFRLAVEASRASVHLAVEFTDRILAPVGLLDLMAKNESFLSRTLTLKSLPAHDVDELRAASLTDIEILKLLQTGLAAFSSMARPVDSRFGVTAVFLASLAKADAAIDQLATMTITDWRSDIIDGHSFWRKFWGGVQIAAGVVVGGFDVLAAGVVEPATLGLATPIAIPAAVASVAAGVGVGATGAKEFTDP